jgi:hypothetical protein
MFQRYLISIFIYCANLLIVQNDRRNFKCIISRTKQGYVLPSRVPPSLAYISLFLAPFSLFISLLCLFYLFISEFFPRYLVLGTFVALLVIRTETQYSDKQNVDMRDLLAVIPMLCLAVLIETFLIRMVIMRHVLYAIEQGA